jgi:hypothetical protein
LTESYDQWHISIYMPTHRKGDEIQQNPIRLQNLLDEAEEQLREGGVSATKARELLAPARGYVEDDIFWQHQSEGLALFLAEEFARYYQLPFDFDELAVVSEHFHIKPLLPLLSDNGRFYVLALDQEEIQLFQGSRYTIGEIDLERVPDGLAEILRWDDPEKRLQQHTGTEAVFDGGVAAVFHGHGMASDDDPKEYIERYFHRVDDGVSDLLAGEEAPLVLAGVDYLLPIYQEANSYPHLLEEGVERNVQELDQEELHALAWDIVAPLFQASQEEALDVYHHLSGDDGEQPFDELRTRPIDELRTRASDELAEIVPAAYYERVEALFVALDTQRWGTFDPDTGDVDSHDQAEPFDNDLLDFAAAHTLLNGGAVYAVEREAVPGDEDIAAVFRY